jgi:8-oxo-dGTP pyrophosphatase MutT (NUDIX family)
VRSYRLFMINDPVHKVTCFITRPGKDGSELLLFNHPEVGVQIPAGTVNPGEDLESAARREAAEESGLEGLVLLRKLGVMDDPPPPGFVLVTQPTIMYSRPDTKGYDWARLHTGLPVKVVRHEGGFTQVRFEETDHYNDPQYITYSLIGWVPDEALTSQRTRHFFLFKAQKPTPDRWSVPVDYTTFELFWAPINDLPLIIPPQSGWVRWIASIS